MDTNIPVGSKLYLQGGDAPYTVVTQREDDTAEGCITVVNSRGYEDMVFPEEIDHVVPPVNALPNTAFQDLLDHVLGRKPVPPVTPAKEVMLAFSDTPGEDAEADSQKFLAMLLWLAARYKQTVSFRYEKVPGAFDWHTVEVHKVESTPGMKHILFGGLDEKRDGAYRQFTTDKVSKLEFWQA